jgi:hypothetical protein
MNYSLEKFKTVCERDGVDDMLDAEKTLAAVSLIFYKMKSFVADPQNLTDEKMYEWSSAIARRRVNLNTIKQALLNVEQIKWAPTFDDFLKKIVLSIDYDVDLEQMSKEARQRLNAKCDCTNHSKMLYNVLKTIYKMGYTADEFNQLGRDERMGLFKKAYDFLLSKLSDPFFQLVDLPNLSNMLTHQKPQKTQQELDEAEKAKEKALNEIKLMLRGGAMA